MHKNILNQNNSVLLVIDIQEKFRTIIPQGGELIENSLKLIKTAKLLDMPVIYTEQYPKGVGKTVEELLPELERANYFEKIHFSCCGNQEFVDYLKSLNRKQVIVCGIEAHICVNQTVHALLELGFYPHVIKDATFSRFPSNAEIGLNKMSQAGAVISCVEMALFELMVTSKHKNFKEIQKLII